MKIMAKDGAIRGRFSREKRNNLIFYILMVALPLLQFIVFYIIVNANSVLLSFKEYQRGDSAYIFVGLSNFKTVLHDLFHNSELIFAAKNSIIMYAVSLLVGVPLALLFSYYIYKQKPLSKTLQVILFMPSIISAIIMSVIFLNFTDRVIPMLAQNLFGKEVLGLLSNEKTAFPTMVFYNVWISFGVSVLLYSGQMSSIDESLSEAARLDGAGDLKEFWYISLPLCYPTIVTFLVVGVGGIFTNQMNLFSVYGESAPSSLYTFGYFLFVRVQRASVNQYPYLSAMGVIMTLVAAPLTLLIKYLLEKFGPSAD